MNLSLWMAVVLMNAFLLAAAPTPPRADKHPVPITLHGESRVDDYAWMRDRENPATLAYLNAENAYTEVLMAHTQELQGALYREMLGRIKESDLSVPFRKGPFYYYSRTVEGLSYRIHCRKFGSLDAPEEIVLDENALSGGHEFFTITDQDLSPDGRYLAYAVDTTGYEEVRISIKDLATGITHPDVITKAGPWGVAWGADGKTLFYTRTDAAKRANRVYRHTFGKKESEDQLIFQEDDERFRIGLSRSRSDRFILIESHSSTTSEIHFLDAREPGGTAALVAARRPGTLYSIDHRIGPDDGWFYILTDADGAPNFKLVRTPVKKPGPEHWTPVIDHSPDVYIQGHSVFADHLVLEERRGGATAIRVLRFRDGSEHLLELPEQVATVSLQSNPEYETSLVRFEYQSLVTPPTVYDYHMESRERTLLKQQEVLGGYDPSRYESARLMARAPDGTEVPISIVHRKNLARDGKNRCLLGAYGSYGISSDPGFSSHRISLLDRGFVVAVAHVRGGGEMGRHWKEDGKLLKKKNTFTDFIACAEHLIAEGYTSRERLAIKGGSAGGLLIGAVLNLRPDLFAAAHAQVPFVDVINTMLDASIPLTTEEYEEWGNPNEREFYTYMRGYSPYENVKRQEYPDLLVTAGLNDPRVHYWEPAKWVARLRELKTDDHLLLLKTNMGAGHGGASGRYGRLHEQAFEMAFIIDRLGAPIEPVKD